MWGCTYPCSQLNASFYFPTMLIYFLEVSFCFLELPFCFRECPFVFQNCLSFIYCMHLFEKCFSPTDCTISSCHSELLGEIIYDLLLFCFLLELFIDQLHHHPRFRGRCWMHDLQNEPHNYQETMILGRWGIEHANENFFLFLMIFDRVFEYLEMQKQLLCFKTLHLRQKSSVSFILGGKTKPPFSLLLS